MAGEYQFSLIDVTKQQGTKTILKDVCLSFFYGAHIGVIGGNGAGKSSLLKILAGIDTDIRGTCQVAKGTKVGYLPQEPELDDAKTVGEIVEEGVAEAKAEKSRQKLIENELKWIQTNPSGRHSKSQARVKRYEELQSRQVNTREDDLVIHIPPGPRLGNLVVRAEHVKMAFGDRVLYPDLNFDLPRGGIVGVIGANGAGKTTLFKLITGELKPVSGTLTVGETVKLSYVDQTRSELKPDQTVYEAITGGGEFVRLAGEAMMNGRAYCSRFNFRGAEQQKKVGVLSGGERNRVHLAKLLTSGGNLLLLDEPTNDLDVATLRSLEEGLEEFGGCVMVVSHDRWFLDRIATHILAFEPGGKTTWFEGGYSDYHEMLERRRGK